jgi:hypothetical protein
MTDGYSDLQIEKSLEVHLIGLSWAPFNWLRLGMQSHKKNMAQNMGDRGGSISKRREGCKMNSFSSLYII